MSSQNNELIDELIDEKVDVNQLINKEVDEEANEVIDEEVDEEVDEEFDEEFDEEVDEEDSVEYYSSSSDENLENSDNIDLTGKIIKNYNVICELGRGSFSIVWLVYSIINNNFYALKVQNPNEYKDGLSEIKFVQKLPKNPPIFNNIIEYFVEQKNKQKYLCSIWKLKCTNIDGLIRKGVFANGFDFNKTIKIMKQLITSIKILHKKFKVFHGDIKSDNILVKGLNEKDKFLIEKYLLAIKNIKFNNINKILREQIHYNITNKILEEYNLSDIDKYDIEKKYLDNIEICLADFGTHCEEHNYYEESFGTRYYQAPEIILMGKCKYPVDIWALGCTFYELLSGKLLFDPIKDSTHSRDYYHLSLINDTCGDFSENFLKKTKFYKNYFIKTKLIDYTYPQVNRLDHKLDELNLNESNKLAVKRILLGLLQIDPNKRWTIDTLSNDPLFN
jgi:serine/threonine protein kinase